MIYSIDDPALGLIYFLIDFEVDIDTGDKMFIRYAKKFSRSENKYWIKSKRTKYDDD